MLCKFFCSLIIFHYQILQVEAETNNHYKQYLHQKREEDRSRQEYKRLQIFSDQMIKRGQLIDCIRYKDRRSQEVLAYREDKKASNNL